MSVMNNNIYFIFFYLLQMSGYRSMCLWCKHSFYSFPAHTFKTLRFIYISHELSKSLSAEDSEKMNTGTNHCYNSLVLIQQFTIKPSADSFWTASFDSNVFSVFITHLPLEAILNPSFNGKS